MNEMWAIICNDPEYGPGEHLIGWGWFRGVNAPISRSGRLGPALFPSRELARAELPRIKRTYPKAAVKKVSIKIKEVF